MRVDCNAFRRGGGVYMTRSGIGICQVENPTIPKNTSWAGRRQYIRVMQRALGRTGDQWMRGVVGLSKLASRGTSRGLISGGSIR